MARPSEIPFEPPGAGDEESGKRRNGQYFTRRSPFSHPAFISWAGRAGLPEQILVEPFAGANGIVTMLREQGLVKRASSFDITPAHRDVLARDVFADYPDIVGVAVTNPPYMARNSAMRRGLAYPNTPHADLYLYALDLMLGHHDYVAAIIPAAFGTSHLFRSRLTHVIALPFNDMFGDTDHPVCLSLFEPQSAGAAVWSWDHHVGPEDILRSHMSTNLAPVKIRFNDPSGILGLRATDMTTGPTIAFCRGDAIPATEVKRSSRALTRMSVEGVDEDNLEAVVACANAHLGRLRKLTADTTMTPFKGIRKDGAFRRRLDYSTARVILTLALKGEDAVE